MKQMHLIWALLCAGCGGDSFRAEAAADTHDSGASSTVRSSDAGGSTGGAGGEDVAGGAGGSTVGTAGTSDAGGATGEDAGVSGSGGSDEGDAGGVPSAGAGGFGGTGGIEVGGVGGTIGGAGGTGGCEPVTHDNGLGQTWQDCVPLETYNTTQAGEACNAWCDEAICAGSGCWTAAPCGFNQIMVIGQVGSGNDATMMAWSISSGAVNQVGSLGCLVVGTWR